MVARTRVIHIEPDSELGRVLDEADESEVVLEKGGRRFRLVHQDSPIDVDERAARAWAALERSFGILKGIDRERLKAELREQRGQDSQGRPGW